MTNLAQWSALVGFVLPLLVTIIQQSHFSRRLRTVIGAVASVVAAIITAMVQNQLTWNTWATSMIAVGLAALTSYRNLWVPLGAIDWLEAKTSGKSVCLVKTARVHRTGESS